MTIEAPKGQAHLFQGATTQSAPLCTRCGRGPARPSKDGRWFASCEACAAKRRAEATALQRRKRDLGQCRYCPREAVRGRVFCQEHLLGKREKGRRYRNDNAVKTRARALAHQRRQYLKKKARGICVSCANVAEPGRVLCLAHRLKQQAHHRERKRKDPAALRSRLRRNKLRRVYGLTPEQANQMLLDQRNRCAICQRQFVGEIGGTAPNIDHDAATGGVRSILCGHCNRGLGLFGHDPARLAAAAAYLETWRARHGAMAKVGEA